MKVLVETLRVCGETTNDLITNLFQAYAACSDQQFVKHFGDIQSQWEDNEKPLTEVQLMEKALKKHRLLKDRGNWEAPSAGCQDYCSGGEDTEVIERWKVETKG